MKNNSKFCFFFIKNFSENMFAFFSLNNLCYGLKLINLYLVLEDCHLIKVGNICSKNYNYNFKKQL